VYQSVIWQLSARFYGGHSCLCDRIFAERSQCLRLPPLRSIFRCKSPSPSTCRPPVAGQRCACVRSRCLYAVVRARFGLDLALTRSTWQNSCGAAATVDQSSVPKTHDLLCIGAFCSSQLARTSVLALTPRWSSQVYHLAASHWRQQLPGEVRVESAVSHLLRFFWCSADHRMHRLGHFLLFSVVQLPAGPAQARLESTAEARLQNRLYLWNPAGWRAELGVAGRSASCGQRQPPGGHRQQASQPWRTQL